LVPGLHTNASPKKCRFPDPPAAGPLAANCFPPVDVVFATPAEIPQTVEAQSPFLLSILGSGIVFCHQGA
jgi:hypothetical protein